MRLAFIVTVSLALAACSSGSEVEESSFEIDSESGEVSATITNDEGTATLQSGEKSVAKLPMGFSLFPGAEVVNSTTFERDGTTISITSLASDASPAQLVAHYREEAEAAGIEIKLEMSVNDGQMIGGDDGKGNMFSLDSKKAGMAFDPFEDEDEGEDSEEADPQSDQAEDDIAADKTTATLTLSGKFAK